MTAGLLGLVHGRYVYERRLRVLSRRLGELLPETGRVLDVGSGDGRLAAAIAAERPGLELAGVDVLVRPATAIPVEQFDGRTIPHPDRSFDAVLLVDVLHHADDPELLLREAARAAPIVVLKDHCADGLLAEETLRLMDRVGNARFGVALPYRYLRRAEWFDLFSRLGLAVEGWDDRLGLYPPPASLVFERSLHFLARLRAA